MTPTLVHVFDIQVRFDLDPPNRIIPLDRIRKHVNYLCKTGEEVL